jgi:L-alanine-DL-glutamate epimerase-like enolase superfamily enzyme
MRLASIACYGVTMDLRAGPYAMSHGRVLERLESTIVEVVAEDGTRGYGEVNTLASTYIEGFPGSVRAAVAELAPHLLGVSVLEGGVLNARMDAVVLGHAAAKSALDAALWDVRGRILDLPAVTLMGGAQQADYPIYHPLSLGSPTQMAEEAKRWADTGIRNWQLKVGNNPLDDAERLLAVLDAVPDRDFVTADANRGWSLPDATRFLRAIDGADTYVEQPCETLEQQAQLRARSAVPFIADESIRHPHELVRGFAAGALDGINIKPARVGGMTKAAQMADLGAALGIRVVFDEPMGGELAMAALAHLSGRTGPETLLATLLTSATLLDHSTQPWLSGATISCDNGRAVVPTGPGLGVDVDPRGLGQPLFVIDKR